MPIHRSRRTKLSAVLAADMVGLRAAERETGIPESSIRYWMEDPDFAQFRANARKGMEEEVTVVARLAWRRVAQSMDTMEPRDAMFAADKATTLYLLMTGEATARTEHVDSPDPNADLSGARTAYLSVLSGGSGAVGGRNGTGPASNGHAALPALSLPDEAHGGRVAAPADPQGPADGHQPDGGDRGEVAS